jgi:hypothetical protein
MTPKDFPQLMRGALAASLVGATIYGYLFGSSVPEGLLGLSGAAIAFYFKSEGQ